MSIKFPYKVLAVFMAFLMFFSSIGFSLDIHYCGNELQNVALFGKAKECEMMAQVKEEEKSSCCESTDKKVQNCHNKETAKGNCCHNKKLIIENGEFEKLTVTKLDVQPLISVVVFLYSYFKIVSKLESEAIFNEYNPPPLTKNISILHQVFRI